MKRVHGRVAVVTGAASGIGLATAELLARNGCSLALVDIDEERLEAAGQQIEALGVRATRHIADVADAERMQALPGEVVAEHREVLTVWRPLQIDRDLGV